MHLLTYKQYDIVYDTVAWTKAFELLTHEQVKDIIYSVTDALDKKQISYLVGICLSIKFDFTNQKRGNDDDWNRDTLGILFIWIYKILKNNDNTKNG